MLLWMKACPKKTKNKCKHNHKHKQINMNQLKASTHLDIALVPA